MRTPRERALTHVPNTLVDCGCQAFAYADHSGIDIDYCPLHRAAPDLLSACMLVVGFCVDFRQRVPDWERFPEVGKMFAMITKVIEKAEGK